MKQVCKSLNTRVDNHKVAVIANPVLWDEAICGRLLRRLKNRLLVKTLEY